MSTIRIFSKKAFAIGPGASRDGNGVEHFITVPNAIQDMPEKYSDDPTFKLACSVGDIHVMNANVSSSVEKNFDDSIDVDKVDPVEEFYESLKTKNKEETKELAAKYGAEYIESDKLSMNKKRVFEAYKLSLSDTDN